MDKRPKNKDRVFVVGRLTCSRDTASKVSREIKGTEERRRRGEKVWFHMQVAVKDVYLKGPISPLPPKLEMNKSLAQFTWADGPISSGDPDYPNRLHVIMSTSVFIWDFTRAFIGAERAALQVKHGQSAFKKGHLERLQSAPESKHKTYFPDVWGQNFETSGSVYTSSDWE